MASYWILQAVQKILPAEVYSEVAKLFGRVYTRTYAGQNDSLEVFLTGRGLGTFPGRYSITMEVVLWITAQSVYKYRKFNVGCGCRCVLAQIIFLYTFCDSQ